MSSTSSTSSTSDVSNGRYWGLSSGLNVDSIVNGLLTKEQAKINKANQQEQKLEWQQEAYQDIISKLNDFENAYLSIGKDTSMASSNMYASYTASCNNTSLLTVTANSDANGLPQTVTVEQSATTASVSSSGAINKNTLSGSNTWGDVYTALSKTSGDQSIALTLDDVTKTITFNSTELSGKSAADGTFQAYVQNKLSAAFGTVTDSTDSSKNVPKIAASGGENDKLGFTTASGYSMDLTVAPISSGTSIDATTALGISIGQTNHLNVDSSISSTPLSFAINGKKIDIAGGASVATALSAINNSGAGVTAKYDSTSDTISITANQSGAAGQISITNQDGTALSGNASTFFSQIGINTSTVAAGKDAIVNINGTNYTRSSNKFTISGVSYSINSAVDSTTSATDKTAKLTFSQDTSKLKTGINNFISAYNTLIDAIHTQTNTKPDSNYSPLSDTQKASMTQTQIDSWNTKAKAGILYGDGTLDGICDTMRSLLYKSVTMSDGTNFSLYQMGITTSDDPTAYGKLEITSDNQTKFDNAIAANTDKVRQLFTKTSDTLLSINTKTDAERTAQINRKNDEGLIARLDDTVKAAASRVYGTYGSLIALAGTSTMNSTQNTLYKEINDQKSLISDLTDKMKTKKNKLYSQFQKLETYMSQANSQTSMLSSFGSSS